MNIHQFEELIAEDKLPEALKQLNQFLSKSDADKRNQLIVLRSRYNSLAKQSVHSMIGRETFQSELNQLRLSVLEFLQSLRDKDLMRPTAATHQELANPLLLIGHSEESVADIHHLFSLLRFTETEALLSPADLSKIDFEHFDLVIFDNTDLPPCMHISALQELSVEQQTLIKSRISTMEAILAQSKTFVIHYGNYLYWINQNRKWAHAANSQFSLYARV